MPIYEKIVRIIWITNKIDAIGRVSRLRNQKETKIYSGLFEYYRKFVSNFFTTAKPLIQLLKKDVPFCWLKEQESSKKNFLSVKKKLRSKPILHVPDFS